MVKGEIDGEGWERFSSVTVSDCFKFLADRGFVSDRFGWSNAETFQLASVQYHAGKWEVLITPDGREEAAEFDRKMEGRYA